MDGAQWSRSFEVVLCCHRERNVVHIQPHTTSDRLRNCLNMLHKTSCRFKVYEGARIDENQAAAHGDMSGWAGMSTQDNMADWLTRGPILKELDADSD